MMARSTTRSNQRPDTLIRTAIRQINEDLATHGRTIHSVISDRANQRQRQPMSAVTPIADKRGVRLECAGYLPLATWQSKEYSFNSTHGTRVQAFEQAIGQIYDYAIAHGAADY